MFDLWLPVICNIKYFVFIYLLTVFLFNYRNLSVFRTYRLLRHDTRETHAFNISYFITNKKYVFTIQLVQIYTQTYFENFVFGCALRKAIFYLRKQWWTFKVQPWLSLVDFYINGKDIPYSLVYEADLFWSTFPECKDD